MTVMSWSHVDQEASEIVAAAGEEGIVVRVVGSTGVHLHCAASAAMSEQAGRNPKDIDLIVRGEHRNQLKTLIERRGYEVDRGLLVAMEGKRYSFAHPENNFEIDVFVDRMEFCHTIDLASRLELQSPTISVADLLLQKVQVHEPTHNDIVDAMVILATHPVATSQAGREEIDAQYIARLMARDWGFHHTVTANLEKLRQTLAGEGAHPLPPEAAATGAEQAGALLEAIEREKKTTSWKLRARVGERVKWWEEVSDREDTF